MISWRILHGDVRDKLKEIPEGSVQTCVTSPPYWGLRDYGVPGQLGLEPTPDAYVSNLVMVFREVRRVLSEDGTVWLNLGDSYVAQPPGKCSGDPMAKSGLAGVNTQRVARQSCGDRPLRTFGDGLKQKDLCGIPWRVAFALQADGWYLRSDIIWSKPNPMPESVTDRPTKAHEYIFLLAKRERYYYDSDAIKEQVSGGSHARGNGVNPKCVEPGRGIKQNTSFSAAINELVNYRNKRSVWSVATQPYPEAHFATFPEALIEPCILAGSRPGDTALDPFNGLGTTGAVAVRHQRNYIGIELNPAYIELARKRIGAVAPLFAREEAGEVNA